MHPDWVVSLLNQCEKFDVPFHFKQWGNWVPADLINEAVRPRLLKLRNERPINMARVGKKLAGRILEGTTWDGVPHTPLIHA
jgi:protein gp37